MEEKKPSHKFSLYLLKQSLMKKVFFILCSFDYMQWQNLQNTLKNVSVLTKFLKKQSTVLATDFSLAFSPKLHFYVKTNVEKLLVEAVAWR